MNPIKKLQMEDAAIPDSQKDAAYYWEYARKMLAIGAAYNRSTIFLSKCAIALSVVAILLVAVSVFILGAS